MKRNSAILGAAFLMATSAIGPGFLTQTSLFTQELLTNFGFVILISVLLDIGTQLNIWRVIAISGEHAQDIANKILPGLGFFLATLIGLGGLVFNVGNIAGCGLGIEVFTGLSPKTGALISCMVAISIFWYREAGRLVDNFTKILGLIMIALTVYIAIAAHPPISAALYHTIWPEKIDVMKIVTLVGGTVGGYISFAGVYRLLDAKISGEKNISQVTRSSVSGILITSFMRYILFLAALGVVWGGTKLATGNPASSVFEAAAGKAGYLFFGVVLWIAGITSVIGASYTTISFWKTLVPAVAKNEKVITSCFIILSAFIFVILGNPVRLLILAGAFNGLVLPVALAVILIASVKTSIVQQYKHPLFLQVIGWIVVLVMSWMGYITITQNFSKLF